MVKKAIGRVLMMSILLLLVHTTATESRAGGVVNVHIYMVKGSIWDSPQGTQAILEDRIQAVGIWRSVGVDLKSLPGVKPLIGDPNKELTEEDLKNYAVTLKASARNIVVVYTNKSYKGGRAYASPILEKANTPVIVIVEEAFNNPPTNGYPRRDFAHELGHILIRSVDHVYHQRGTPKADAIFSPIFGSGPANLNLMNQAKNLGTELTDENELYQKKKALEYPCGPGVTNCPEITMAPGARSTVVIKEVNQVGLQSPPTGQNGLTTPPSVATVKPNNRSQQSLTGLSAFTSSPTQIRKQAVGKQITFVCGTGEPVASYNEESVVKVTIGDKPIGSMITYDVPTGTQTLKVVLQPPPNEKYGWIVKEIKFLDMSDLSGKGQQTFTPNAPEANVTLSINERYGTNVSRLEITIDQCGGPSGVTGVKVVRSCTENEIEAKGEMLLCEGDKCRTSSNSRAVLNFLSPNRSVFATVTIPQSSEVEVGGFDTGNVSGAVLALGAGEVQSQVNNIPGVPVQFTVISPAVMVSARGTFFTVRHDRQRRISTIDVKEGAVEVTPTDPTLQAFTMQAGQQIQVAQSNAQPGTGTARGPVIPQGGAPPTGPTAPLPPTAGPVQPGTASSGGIGGTWSTPSGDTIILTQTGNRVTGTYRGVLGTGILSGTFDGRTLTGTIEAGRGGITVTDTFTLRLTPEGRLEGRVGSSVLSVEVILIRRP